MGDEHISRRAFVATAVAGVAGTMLPGSSAMATTSPANLRAKSPLIPRANPPEALKLGVASYSLRQFPRAKAIEMVKVLGTPYVNIKSVHLDYALSAAEIAAARREFESAGLTIVGGGTITFERDTDEDVRKYFEYAKAAGMPLIVITCAPAVLPRIEQFAVAYNISVAIHNHGPGDTYPSPYDALRHIEHMDSRMGVCVDVGHTARTGADVVKVLADAGPRVLDMHFKDLRDLSKAETQVAVGEGNMPVAEIFRQLIAMRYAHYVNLEYEINENDPLPGMQLSFAYMRGVLAGLAPGTKH